MNITPCPTEQGTTSPGQIDLPLCWSEELPGEGGGGDGWKTYWEQLDDRQTVFRVQSEEYAENLAKAIPLPSPMRVLDFGCGFGYVAEKLAPQVGELYLWDASANMRRHARVRMTRFANVRYLDLSSPAVFPPDPGLDLIAINSVVQYMTPEEFSGWLVYWKKMLVPGGRIVISDLIPPAYAGGKDLLHVLRLSARRGFLLRAIYQALGEIFRYYRTRQSRPLTRIGKEELTHRGEAAGLTVDFLPQNLTHFPDRITAVFTNPTR